MIKKKFKLSYYMNMNMNMKLRPKFLLPIKSFN